MFTYRILLNECFLVQTDHRFGTMTEEVDNLIVHLQKRTLNFGILDIEYIHCQARDSWVSIPSGHRCIIRKMAILCRNGSSSLCQEFRPCLPYKDLSKRMQKTFCVARRKCHKLSYMPRNSFVPDCIEAYSILLNFFREHEIKFVLHKGGDIERKVCENLPNILENMLKYLKKSAKTI